MLFTLPSDLTLYILSFLSFHDITPLYVLSRSVQRFLNDHEDALYHQLAVAHRFAVKGVSLDDARDGGYHLRGAKSWKELCRESVILERNLSGRGFVVQGGYTCFTDPNGVQQFAIDEQRGLLLVLTTAKEFSVRTLDGARVLWTMPEVAHFAHSGDFLLLWRGQNTTGQIQAWRFVSVSTDTTTQHLTLTLHASLPTPPGGWRTTALHAPLLALVNRDHPHLVHIYDLTSSGGEPGAVRVVDLDGVLLGQSRVEGRAERGMLVWSVLLDLQLSKAHRGDSEEERKGNGEWYWMCACLDVGVIWVRLNLGQEGGKAVGTAVSRDAVLYEDFVDLGHLNALPKIAKLPTTTTSTPRTADRVDVPRMENVTMAVVVPGAEALAEHAVPRRRLHHAQKSAPDAKIERRRNWPCYISAQFSPDGRHVVVGTTSGQVYLFPDIHRLFDAGVNPEEIVQKLTFEEPVRFVQWEAQERMFVVRDDENQTWLVDLHPTYHAHPDSVTRSSDLSLDLLGARVFRIRTFGRSTKGVQVRQAGVWAVADLGEVVQGEGVGRGGNGVDRHAGEDEDGREGTGGEVAEALGRATKTVCFVSFARDGMLR